MSVIDDNERLLQHSLSLSGIVLLFLHTSCSSSFLGDDTLDTDESLLGHM